ncbi:hypothetical protein IRJ41_001037 [Triplophysa rosa]|uniref:3',5'-cyclic-GMP phosphodiesterase n=1 Tax=Triplophysa rosa TaxID=992332 RepID=A0A9W7T2P5_TRIRA|nr:hypothetical protein IRJ41_001037 [Triplophysa rosa]
MVAECSFLPQKHDRKRKKTYHFHNEWEEEFFFTTVKETCVCLICGATVATAKWHNVERHFTTCHKSYHANYPPGSALRTEKACELKAALGKQQSFFTRPAKKSQKATEASFRATHFLIKKKKAFSDGEVFKEAMMITANTVLKDEKNGTDLISTLSDVQLGASTMARRVSDMSGNLADQLDRDLSECSWFSIQCDESVDSSSTAQLLVFIWMVFEDFSTREELLTLLPLKTTMRGVDIYNTVKEFFVQKKVPLEKLVAVTTDGAPAMIGRHTGFIAHCKSDPDFSKFLHYHCIIHQQALCAKVIGFGHVMTPVVKIINDIRSKAKQHRIFKVLLEEMSAEYGDLLLHTEIRWLSRGRVLLRFLSLLGEIKEFKQSKGEDVSLLEDTEWTLDLAFLTDITGKLNDLNCQLQGKAEHKSPSVSEPQLQNGSDGGVIDDNGDENETTNDSARSQERADMNSAPPAGSALATPTTATGPTTPKKGPPKFKQRQTRTFKSKAPKPGQKGFGDDIPGMEGLGTGEHITVVCPWEAFGDMELSDLAKYGII